MRTFKIGDPDNVFESVYVDTNWSVQTKIKNRSTLTCTVVSKENVTEIDFGLPFRLYDSDGTTKIFEGIIFDIDDYEDTPGFINYDLTVVDNSAIADRRIINDSYENKTCGYIVNDIITNYLADEGITPGTIRDGNTIVAVSFPYMKASEVLDYLCKNISVGYYWFIDSDKALHFASTDQNISEHIIDDNFQLNSFKRNRTGEEYRNVQIFKGGYRETATQSNEELSPACDGTTASFITRYPIASQPTIQINLNGAGWITVDSSKIGIVGIDDDTAGIEWFWSYNSDKISQAKDLTVLTSADKIRCTYTGLVRLLLYNEEPNSISEMQSITGGTGRFEEIKIDSNINNIKQAKITANSMLETYATIKDKITFRTLTKLTAGQLIKVEKSLFGINEFFLIESVNYNGTYNEDIEYTVTCIDGVSVGGWIEYFKDLCAATKKVEINNNEIIFKVISQPEKSKIVGNWTMILYESIYPSNDLYPSDDLYPGGTEVSNNTLND